MKRGVFNSISDSDPYKGSRKEWFIQLNQVRMFWYELSLNSPEAFDSRKLVSDSLKSLKKEVEENLEKRFIYFICSKKRVRFNLKKKPKYSLFSGYLKIYIEIGRERKQRCIILSLRDIETGELIKPEIKIINEKFISIINKNNSSITYSIHDLLRNSNINIGFGTEIHYVGYTKNPDKRPTNGVHAGLNKVLHNVSNEDNDILIYFNLFNVSVRHSDPSSMFQFSIANSLIDEVKVDLEGLIIEKCLILYFDADNQTENKIRERSELKNNLNTLSSDNKIDLIHFIYEFENECEYFKFYSSKIIESYQQTFTAKLDCDEPSIYQGTKLFPESIQELINEN